MLNDSFRNWLAPDSMTRAADLEPVSYTHLDVYKRQGDRHAGRREHDHQRRYPANALVGGAQGNRHDLVEVGCLVSRGNI